MEKASIPDILQEMIDRGIKVRAVGVYKGWMDVDDFGDYMEAWSHSYQ
jgi:NDP-sugar pyrophosphorylase family protein